MNKWEGVGMKLNDEIQVFKYFFQVFEWVYDVKISMKQKQQIQNLFQANLANSKPLRDYIVYILKRHAELYSLDPEGRTIGAKLMKKIFKIDLISHEDAAHAIVLKSIHAIVEQLKPGATGIDLLSDSTSISADNNYVDVEQDKQATLVVESSNGGNAWQKNHKHLKTSETAIQDANIKTNTQTMNMYNQFMQSGNQKMDPQKQIELEKKKALQAEFDSAISKIRYDATMSVIRNI